MFEWIYSFLIDGVYLTEKNMSIKIYLTFHDGPIELNYLKAFIIKYYF